MKLVNLNIIFDKSLNAKRYFSLWKKHTYKIYWAIRGFFVKVTFKFTFNYICKVPEVNMTFHYEI